MTFFLFTINILFLHVCLSLFLVLIALFILVAVLNVLFLLFYPMYSKFFRNCIKCFACLAIALFAMANKPCFADSIEPLVSFSCYDSSESPIYTYSSDIGNFYTYLDIALSARSDLGLFVHSSDLKNALISLDMAQYFTNWDPYNPLFYCNVGFTTRSGYNTFYFRFVKYNTSLDDYSLTVGNNYYNISSPYGFFPLRHRDMPSPFIVSSVSGPTYYSGVGMDTDFYGTPVSYSHTVTLGYDNYDISNDSFFFSQAFDDFLSDSDQFVFGLFVVFDSSWNLTSRSSYFVNEFYRGFNPTPSSTDHFILNTYTTFNTDSSSWTVSTSPLFGGDFLSLLYYSYVDTGTFSLDVFYPFALGLSVSGHDPSLPTPTPVPTQIWVTPTPIIPIRDSELPTPTPYPSVSVAPLPTGIVTDYIPLLDLPSTESIVSNITGIIKEFNSIFSRKVFALGSYTLQVMYYFSGWFKFIFIVPAGVFIAFLIGRLRKK